MRTEMKKNNYQYKEGWKNIKLSLKHNGFPGQQEKRAGNISVLYIIEVSNQVNYSRQHFYYSDIMIILSSQF